MYRQKASGEPKRGGINRSAFIWSFNLSHLVFSSSCLGEADRTSVKMNLKEPSLLASFETRRGLNVWASEHTKKKKFNVGFQKKKFPVKEAGSATKSTDDLAVV